MIPLLPHPSGSPSGRQRETPGMNKRGLLSSLTNVLVSLISFQPALSSLSCETSNAVCQRPFAFSKIESCAHKRKQFHHRPQLPSVPRLEFVVKPLQVVPGHQKHEANQALKANWRCLGFAMNLILYLSKNPALKSCFHQRESEFNSSRAKVLSSMSQPHPLF